MHNARTEKTPYEELSSYSLHSAHVCLEARQQSLRRCEMHRGAQLEIDRQRIYPRYLQQELRDGGGTDGYSPVQRRPTFVV